MDDNSDVFHLGLHYCKLSRDMRFPTKLHFDMNRLRRAGAASF